MRWHFKFLVAGLAFVTVGVTCAVAATSARACLHSPREVSKQAVAQSDQTALVYYADGQQHMFLRTGVKSTEKLRKLGWVIPVPSQPDEYETASADLFGELQKWMNLRVEYERRTMGMRKSAGTGGSSDPTSSDALTVHQTVEAGPYAITPLEASGRAGVKALKKWLRENGFREPESTKPARYYIEHDWTFLAIRVTPPEGADSLPSNGALRPLHLSFSTDRVVYPLKFETNQGLFSATIYLVSNGKIPTEMLRGARSRGFFVAGIEDSTKPVDKPDGSEEPSSRERLKKFGIIQEPVERVSRPRHDPYRFPAEKEALEVFDRERLRRDSERQYESTRDPLDPIGDPQKSEDGREPEVTFNPVTELPAQVEGISEVSGEKIELDFPHDCRYLADHGTILHHSAPATVADALGSAGAWYGTERLYIRVLHAPAVNAGAAEPDTWTHDLAIPAVTSDKTFEDYVPEASRPGWLGCGQVPGRPRRPWLPSLAIFAGVLALRSRYGIGGDR